MIEPENSEELLKEIISLLNDKTKLSKLSKAAFEKVQEYDWSNIGKKYLDLYKKILES